MGPIRLEARLAWTVAILLVSAYALWRGGVIERLVAVANLLAWFATMLVQNRLGWADPQTWVDPQWGVLAVDVAFGLLLLGLAMCRDRSWLICAAAFQLLGVVTHVAMILDDGFRARTYLTGLIIWSYLVLGSLGVGTWIRWRERQARLSRHSPPEPASPGH